MRRHLSKPLRRLQRGLSLVEAMVGLTVGLIIVAGATMLVTTQITDHRRLMLETQMQQDLRAAADLILHEVRRAGFWERGSDGIWAPGESAPVSNPYGEISPATTGTESQVTFRVSKAQRQFGADIDDNTVTDDEIRSFSKSDDGVLLYQMARGSAPQPLTDPGIMVVDTFNVALDVQSLPLEGFCNQPCPVGSTTCPQQEVRHVVVSISAHLVSNPTVVRNVQLGSRLRNDRIVGACP